MKTNRDWLENGNETKKVVLAIVVSVMCCLMASAQMFQMHPVQLDTMMSTMEEPQRQQVMVAYYQEIARQAFGGNPNYSYHLGVLGNVIRKYDPFFAQHWNMALRQGDYYASLPRPSFSGGMGGFVGGGNGYVAPRRACSACGGTGSCRICKGTGRVTNGYTGSRSDCSACRGSGRCTVCGN